jgi:hypothetical protein
MGESYEHLTTPRRETIRRMRYLNLRIGAEEGSIVAIQLQTNASTCLDHRIYARRFHIPKARRHLIETIA